MNTMKQYKIEDCFNLRARIGWQGLRAEEFTDYGPYLVTGTDFANGKIDWDTCYHVDEHRFKQDVGIQLREHDLLITKDGTIGKTAVVQDCPEKVTLNSGVFVVRAINGNIVSEYLYYVLNSRQFDLFMRNILTGSTIKHLNQEHFYKFAFEAPDVTRQSKIAEILSSVDEAIDKTCALIEKYKNIKAGMMQDLLGSGDEVFLGDKRYFDINPRTSSLPRCFYYIDLESVISGELLKQDIFERAYAPSRAQRLLKSNDILFQMVRPYQQNNYYFEQEFDLPSVASTGYAQIRTSQNPKFLYYALHTNRVLGSVIAKCTGSNYPAINSTELKRVSINLPSIDEQNRIGEQITAADERIQTERDYLAKLQNIKLGLMQDLLTNTVSVDALL
jgi:type I restriction enzyme S subunit